MSVTEPTAGRALLLIMRLQVNFYVNPITFQETDVISVNLTFLTNVRTLSDTDYYQARRRGIEITDRPAAACSENKIQLVTGPIYLLTCAYI